MIILFKRETQINCDNLPELIFTIATSCNVNHSGELLVDTANSRESVRNFLHQQGFQNTLYDPANDTIIVLQNPPAIAPHIAVEVVADTAIEETDNGDEENNDEENNDEENNQIETSIPAIHGIPVSEEELIKQASALVPPEQGSSAALYLRKVNEFNRLWGNIVIMKRQIDKLMKTVSESEILKSIKSDIEYLQTKCSIVDSVAFMPNQNSSLVITTKEIVSAVQPKYGSRIIGRMQIIIDLRYLYSTNPPSSDFTRTIDIVNIDRNPRLGGSYWACGHVNRARLDGPAGICYGGYFQQMFDAITSRNLSQLFDIVIRFIQNPNEEDAWGRNISLFPEATHET